MEYRGLYVNLSSVNPGVVKKTINISKALNSFDCVTFSLIEPGFKLNHEVVDEHGLKKVKLSIYSSFKIQYLLQKSMLKYFPIGFIRSWMFKKMFFKSLLKYQLINNIDIIIIRYPFASLPLYNFLKISTSKVFLEFNTFELEEFKAQSKYFYLKSKYFLELILRKNILRASKGFFGVTDEIINYQKKFLKISDKPTFLLSNGVQYDYIISNTHKKKDRINFVILVGEEQPWHGIDRLILSLKRFPLKENSRFYIIGKLSKSSENLIRNALIKNVSFDILDSLTFSQIKELFKKIHVGISSLCLFKNSMNEASPLKVRDFALNGLPILLAYLDTDFSSNEKLEKFTFQVENNDSPINFNLVVSWYKKFNEYSLFEFQKNSLEILSYKNKLQPFISYLKKSQ